MYNTSFPFCAAFHGASPTITQICFFRELCKYNLLVCWGYGSWTELRAHNMTSWLQFLRSRAHTWLWKFHPLFQTASGSSLSVRASGVGIFVTWNFGEWNRALWVPLLLLSMSCPLWAHILSNHRAQATKKYTEMGVGVLHARGLGVGLVLGQWSQMALLPPQPYSPEVMPSLPLPFPR